jgi:hypothetical protein
MAEIKESDDIEIVETLPTGTPAEDVNPRAAEADDADDIDSRDINPDNPDETDAEREAIRERRRKEKQERKERRDQAISRDKLELDFLRKRNEDLERRQTALEQRAHKEDFAAVDNGLKAALNEVKMAEDVIAKAVAAGNGEDVAQALRYRDQAISRAQQLSQVKQQVSAPRPEPGLDPAVAAHAQEFVKENPWYDPQARDEDSAIVLAVDQALARDGYDPKNQDYWAELRKRVARRLPDRMQKAEERVARGGPSVGSGREHAPATTRREVYVSPERKQALVDAGVWDDPVLRQKYVKRYMEYDRTKRA